MPSIDGIPQVGETFDSDIGSIFDTDGLPTWPDDFDIQWVRVDGSNETDISGETSENYTLTNDDLGKQLKVKVSFTDDAGNAEGPLTSDAFPSNGYPKAVIRPAQDDCADRTGADYCATLTVGSHESSGTTFYGRGSAGGGTPAFGGLTPHTFTVGSASYLIDYMRIEDRVGHRYLRVAQRQVAF